MIQGNIVRLRKLTAHDLPLLYKWINNPEVTPYWYGRDKPRSMQWVDKHFMLMITGKSVSSCWIIEVKRKPIGFMYNTPEKNDDNEFNGRVELDILIGEESQWGKDYGTDAFQAMIRYVFEIQKAERIFLTPRKHNERAIRLYEKVGFKKEGVLRHFEKFEENWTDCIMMSITKNGYKNL